jgi:predicted kinase
MKVLIMIIIVCGLPGVGKTTLARQLAPFIKAVVLSTDKIRKELFPKPLYGRRERRLVYDVLLLMAKYLHEANVNCILDGTFSQERSRQGVMRKLNIPPNRVSIIECFCPEEIVILRLRIRKHDYSDADFSIYQRMKKIYEPVKGKHITVDTSNISKSVISTIASELV